MLVTMHATHHGIVSLMTLFDVSLVGPEALDGEEMEAGILSIQTLGHAQDPLVIVAGPDGEYPIVVPV